MAFYIFFYERNWAEAEREFKRALELNPNYPVAHRWYARYLTAMGRHDEAIAEIKRAVELDPLSLNENSIAGWILREARRYDQAIEQYRKTIEMDPNFRPAHVEIGWAYLHKGMRQEAIAEFQKAIELAGISLQPGAMKIRVGYGPVGGLAYAYGVTGNSSNAAVSGFNVPPSARQRAKSASASFALPCIRRDAATPIQALESRGLSSIARPKSLIAVANSPSPCGRLHD